MWCSRTWIADVLGVIDIHNRLKSRSRHLVRSSTRSRRKWSELSSGISDGLYDTSGLNFRCESPRQWEPSGSKTKIASRLRLCSFSSIRQQIAVQLRLCYETP